MGTPQRRESNLSTGGSVDLGSSANWQQQAKAAVDPRSVPLEDAYSTALVSHQRARLERMRLELEKAKTDLRALHEDLNAKKRAHSVYIESYTSYPSEENIFQLEAETSALQSELVEARNRVKEYTDLKQEPKEEEGWTCGYCTTHNHPAIPTCEVCDMPHTASVP